MNRILNMLQRFFLYIGLLALLNLERIIYLSASKIIRDANGDLFATDDCVCNRETTQCRAGSEICRQRNALCENSLCCFCRCRATEETYVHNIMMNVSRCSGSTKLPEILNIAREDHQYRLVGKVDGSDSCTKKNIPVIKTNARGSHPLEMCLNGTRLSKVQDCNVDKSHSNPLKYFVDGVWHPYPLKAYSASFQINRTKDGLMLKWNKGFGSQSINQLFAISVSCLITGSNSKKVKTCLLVKSSNFTRNTDGVIPSKTPTAKTKFKGSPSHLVVATKMEVKDTESLSVTQREVNQTFSTELPVTKAFSEEKVKFFTIAVVGCTVFIACMSIICILLCLVRRKRRKELNRLNKRNPLYDEGLSCRFIAAPSKIAHQSGSSQETKLLYQPLIQSTRIKDCKQPSVYQPLAHKTKNMETIKEHNEPPQFAHNAHFHGGKQHEAKSNMFESQNKAYKALTPPKERKKSNLNNQATKPDGAHYSSPEMFKTVIMPVNVKLLDGYYEPECIVLRNMHKQTEDMNEYSGNVLQHEYDALQTNSASNVRKGKREITPHVSRSRQGSNKGNVSSPEYNYLESPNFYQELDKRC